jgi:RNA polymerase sigma factor (sigma-70 family)
MTDNDYEIIQRILAGNKEAYSGIIFKYKDKAMTLAINILKNREDAEDALQDAFIRAYKALRNFEWKSNFSTWFYRILYNVCCTKLKEKKGSSKLIYFEDSEAFFEYTQTESFIEHDLSDHELKRSIKEEMENLDPSYSSILIMYYLQEFGCRQISEVTGISIDTIKIRLFRGREKLRNALLKRFKIKNLKEIEI